MKRKHHKKQHSRSVERRSISRRKASKPQLQDNIDSSDKSKIIVPDIFDSRSRQVRSQQGSRRGEREQGYEINLLMPNYKIYRKNLLEEVSVNSKPNKNQYNILYVIGKGGFGKVWKVQQKKTNTIYAMKQMSKAVILTKKSMQSVLNQRELLKNIRHKFIINMKQAFQDRQHLYLIMDFMPGGDLRYHICKRHKFIQQQVRFFAACIFTGLEYLHWNRILHRDLKPQNLVFDDKGYIHLTDLGIAKYLKTNNFSDTSGTPGYMAPQVMCRQNHSYEVDYYALGVILYELMMGRRPYSGKTRKEIREQVLAKQTVIRKGEIPQGWTIQAADFINKLIQRKPMMRLGWGGSEEVKMHSWLREFPWKMLEEWKVESPFRAYSKYNAQEVRYQQTVEDEQVNNLLNENTVLLRKSSIQQLFEGYSYEDDGKEMESHTTSSELYRKMGEEGMLKWGSFRDG